MMSHLFSSPREDAFQADLFSLAPAWDDDARAEPVGSFWAEATSEQAAVFWQTEAAWDDMLQERESFGWSALHNETLTESQAFASHEELLFNGRAEGGFSVLQWEGAGQVRNIGNMAVDLGRMLTLEIVETGGAPYLLGVSCDADMLVAWRILDDGLLVETSRVDFGAVLGITSAREMTVRVLGDVPYMLIVGENDRAPGVLAMDADGTLHMAEALLDLGVLPGGPVRAPELSLAEVGEPVAFGLNLTISADVPPMMLVPATGGMPVQVIGTGLPGYAGLC